MSNKIENVANKNDLHNVLEKNKLVLLDLWAPWCGPCRAMAPALEEVANEATELKVVKLNIDAYGSEASDDFNVRAIPTLILFKDGVEFKRKTGSVNKSALLEFINS